MALKKVPAETLTYNIDTRIFNDAFLPYLTRIARYEVYFGGAGSGKSWFVADKFVVQLTQMPGRNLLCIRKQKSDALSSCRPQIAKSINKMKLDKVWSWHGDRFEFRNNINGNVIKFEGMDNPEDVKSITFDYGDLTDVWYEEASDENLKENIDLLNLRLRAFGQKNRLCVTFNPININHWLKAWIENELSLESDVIIHRSTYLDNKFADPDYKHLLEGYKRTNPYMYQVYALGEWGVMGKTVFDSNAIMFRIHAIRHKWKDAPPRRIFFEYQTGASGRILNQTIRTHDSLDDEVLIFTPPVRNRPYVIGVDTAGDGSDAWAAHVMDNVTGEQVARFKSMKDAEDCCATLYCLGLHYNGALLGIETNFDSYPIRKMKEFGYPSMYVREGDMDMMIQNAEQRLGFRTHKGNRKAILNLLYAHSKDNMHKINDLDTLSEMQTFVRREKGADIGRWEAAAGAHDDLVMAFAITLAIRHQQSSDIVPDSKPLSGFYDTSELDDMVSLGKITRQDARRYLKSNSWLEDSAEGGSRCSKRRSTY